MRSAEHGPDRLGRLDVEWIAIKAGLKPANRVSIAPEHAADLDARARREGLFVERAPQMAEFPGRPPAAILYISPDAQRARALVDAEAPLLLGERGRLAAEQAVALHSRVGHLLGFPPCCIDAFCTRLRHDVTRRADGSRAHEDFVAAEYAARASRRLLGRLNDLSPDRRARIVTFYPCRYDCPATAEYAAAVFALADRADAAAAAALHGALLGTMSIAANGARGPASTLPGEVLTVEFAEF